MKTIDEAADEALPDGPHAHEPLPLTDLLIETIRAVPGDTFTVGDLVHGLKDRSFGILLLLLAIPIGVPFLYGIPQVLGVPLFALAAQIALGRHEPWLPRAVKARTIPKQGFIKLLEGARRYVGFFEALARPRVSYLTRGAFERLFGVLMVIMSLSILAPLPLTNSIPGAGVAIMAVGMMERDGILLTLGAAVGIGGVIFAISIYGTAIALALHQIAQWLF